MLTNGSNHRKGGLSRPRILFIGLLSVLAIVWLSGKLRSVPDDPDATQSNQRQALSHEVRRDKELPGEPIVSAFVGKRRVMPSDVEELVQYPQLRQLVFYDAELSTEVFSALHVLPGLRSLIVRDCTLEGDGTLEPGALDGVPELWLTGSNIDDGFLLNLRTAAALEDLRLRNTSTDGSGLEALSSLSRFRRLEIKAEHMRPRDQGTQVIDTSSFTDFAPLEELQLSGIHLRPDAAQHIGALTNLHALSLRWLRGQSTRSSDPWHALGNLGGLRDLDLWGSSFDGQVFTGIGGLVNLERLSVQHAGISGEEVHRVANLPHLKELRLEGNAIGDANLEGLAGMVSLQVLTLDGSPIAEAGLEAIGRLTGLLELSLANTRISDHALRHIANLPKLRTLNLSKNRLGEEGFRHLADLGSLTDLNLNHTLLDDRSLTHLAGVKQLQSLSVTGTSVTPEGVRALQAALPSLRVEGEQGRITELLGRVARRAATSGAPTGERKVRALPFTRYGKVVPVDTAFSSDGSVVAVALVGAELKLRNGAEVNHVTLWDASSGGLLYEIPAPPPDRPFVDHTGLSASGHRVAGAWRDGTVTVADVAEQKILINIKAKSRRPEMAISRDGRFLATLAEEEPSSPTDRLQLWDVDDGTLLGEYALPERGEVSLVTFSAGGERLALGMKDGSIHLFDSVARVWEKMLRGHGGPVEFISFSGDDRRLATASWDDSVIRLWDTAHGDDVQTFTGYDHPVIGLWLDEPGLLLASAHAGHTIIRWDVDSGRGSRPQALSETGVEEVRTAHSSFRRYFKLPFTEDGETVAYRHRGTVQVETPPGNTLK